jgi:hypothetical protein
LLLSPLWWGSVPLSIQTWFPFMQGYFASSLIEISLLDLEKMIYTNISLSKNVFPNCGPNWNPSNMMLKISICTISRSFYVNVSFPGPVVLKKKIKWSHPIFITPLKRTLSLICTRLNSFLCEDDLYQVWLKSTS